MKNIKLALLILSCCNGLLLQSAAPACASEQAAARERFLAFLAAAASGCTDAFMSRAEQRAEEQPAADEKPVLQCSMSSSAGLSTTSTPVLGSGELDAEDLEFLTVLKRAVATTDATASCAAAACAGEQTAESARVAVASASEVQKQDHDIIQKKYEIILRLEKILSPEVRDSKYQEEIIPLMVNYYVEKMKALNLGVPRVIIEAYLQQTCDAKKMSGLKQYYDQDFTGDIKSYGSGLAHRCQKFYEAICAFYQNNGLKKDVLLMVLNELDVLKEKLSGRSVLSAYKEDQDSIKNNKKMSSVLIDKSATYYAFLGYTEQLRNNKTHFVNLKKIGLPLCDQHSPVFGFVKQVCDGMDTSPIHERLTRTVFRLIQCQNKYKVTTRVTIKPASVLKLLRFAKVIYEIPANFPQHIDTLGFNYHDLAEAMIKDSIEHNFLGDVLTLSETYYRAKSAALQAYISDIARIHVKKHQEEVSARARKNAQRMQEYEETAKAEFDRHALTWNTSRDLLVQQYAEVVPVFFESSMDAVRALAAKDLAKQQAAAQRIENARKRLEIDEPAKRSGIIDQAFLCMRELASTVLVTIAQQEKLELTKQEELEKQKAAEAAAIELLAAQQAAEQQAAVKAAEYKQARLQYFNDMQHRGMGKTLADNRFIYNPYTLGRAESNNFAPGNARFIGVSAALRKFAAEHKASYEQQETELQKIEVLKMQQEAAAQAAQRAADHERWQQEQQAAQQQAWLQQEQWPQLEQQAAAAGTDMRGYPLYYPPQQDW